MLPATRNSVQVTTGTRLHNHNIHDNNIYAHKQKNKIFFYTKITTVTFKSTPSHFIFHYLSV